MATPEFISSLRAKIGHDLLLVPTVAVLARDDFQRLLLVQDAEGGLWGCPGGIIEPSEIPADAAVRETWEESGMLVELESVLGVFGGEQCAGTYENGDKLAWVATVFAAHVISGSLISDGHETQDARFFSKQDLESLPIKPHTRLFIDATTRVGSETYFARSTWRPSAT